MGQGKAEPIIADLVNRVIDEIQRRGPRTEYITRDWLDKSKAVIPDAIREVLQSVKGLPPPAREALHKIVEEVVLDSWKVTAKQLRPKAWVEKFWAAKTDEDRQRIYMSAVKYIAMDMKRKKEKEAELHVPYDESEGRSEAEGDELPPPTPPMPSSQDNPEAGLLKEKLHEALLELPIMVAVTARLLPLADGNVSKLARHLNLPQRQVARYVARIRKHFAEKGLGPV